MKGITIAVFFQRLRQFAEWLDFCLLVELHREGSAPAACAAGLFLDKVMQICLISYFKRHIYYLLFQNGFINIKGVLHDFKYFDNKSTWHWECGKMFLKIFLDLKKFRKIYLQFSLCGG